MFNKTTIDTGDTTPAEAEASCTPPAAPAVKFSFRPPASEPTERGPWGVRFDFNDGCRIVLPDGDWHVVLRDAGTDNILFETQIGSGIVASTKKYYVPFEFEIRSRDNEVFRHRMDFTGKKVLIQFPVGTLGDLIAWFPYAIKFSERHQCELTVAMGEPIIALFRRTYPSIRFVAPDEVDPARYYATYNIGLFFDDTHNTRQPCDFRLVGLHRTAGHILGVDPSEMRPRIGLSDESRPLDERYVCIAAQSTTQCKYWNHPEGWRQTVQFLKGHGYRVICIDQKATHGTGNVWNHIPYGAEDQTGEKPLAERARWLKHADFFIGLSSGLSWLAWAMGTPVVLISGFTHPQNEFATPYRVMNFHACNSCWNDSKVNFDHQDFLWCPRHAGTSRQFECTRLITPGQVSRAIRLIPGFSR